MHCHLTMNKKVRIYGAIAIILVVLVGIIITTTIRERKNSVKTQPTKYVGTVYLPIKNLKKKWPTNKDWHIVADTLGVKYVQTVNETVLKTIYPKGSYIPSSRSKGGFQFYAQPKTFPTRQIQFSYQIMFPIDFDWLKGGKLPGLWIGNIGANGGNNLQDGSSFRVMWRAGGLAEAYLYVPKQLNTTFYEQPGYFDNDLYGASLWRGVFTFEREVWNNVTLTVKMNTQNNVDGAIGFGINNSTRWMYGFLWMKSTKQVFINGLMMHTFFGGNDATWAPLVEQHVYFKNFVVSNVV
jgi:hypothetical protein